MGPPETDGIVRGTVGRRLQAEGGGDGSTGDGWDRVLDRGTKTTDGGRRGRRPRTGPQFQLGVRDGSRDRGHGRDCGTATAA